MKNSMKWLAAVLFISLPCSVAYGVDVPNAGTISGSINDSKILLPDKNDVDLDIRQKSAEVTEGGPVIQVDRYRITGDLTVSEQELQQVLAAFTGKELTVGQLQQAANQVADYLHKKGYLVAVAYLPEQEISNGIVEITVLIGKYGNIRVENYSRLKDSVLSNIISGIKPGDIIEKNKLEYTLLNLNEVSGVQTQSILTAGQSQGSTDLIVRLFDTPSSSVMIGFDNSGIRTVGGQERANLNIRLNNVSGYGDSVSLGGVSAGKNLYDYSMSYQVPISPKSYTAGFKYERMHYRVGKELSFFEANGQSTIKGIFVDYPLQRSNKSSLNIRFAYDRKSNIDRGIKAIEYQDELGEWGPVPEYASYPKKLESYTLTVSGSSQHQEGAHPSRTNYSFAVTGGKLSISHPQALRDDEFTHTKGEFWKFTSSFSKEQLLTNSWRGHLFVNAQMSSKNLDSSETFSLGGMNGVRAYPQGEAYGDQGYLVTAELRHDLAGPQRQLVLFVDQGGVVYSKHPSADSGNNYRALAGAGLGLIFTNNRDYSIRMDYAWKLSSEKASSDKDKNGRFWLQGVKKL